MTEPDRRAEGYDVLEGRVFRAVCDEVAFCGEGGGGERDPLLA